MFRGYKWRVLSLLKIKIIKNRKPLMVLYFLLFLFLILFKQYDNFHDYKNINCKYNFLKFGKNKLLINKKWEKTMIRPIIIIILIILPFLMILAHKNYLNKNKEEISSLNLIYVSLIVIYVFFIFKLADVF